MWKSQSSFCERPAASADGGRQPRTTRTSDEGIHEETGMDTKPLGKEQEPSDESRPPHGSRPDPIAIEIERLNFICANQFPTVVEMIRSALARI
jgi:hypothetical protein